MPTIGPAGHAGVRSTLIAMSLGRGNSTSEPFTWVGMNRAHCEPMYSFTMFTRVLWSNPRIGPYQFKCVIVTKNDLLHCIAHYTSWF